ncbi:MAG: hypothetical protein FRX48_01445 [Lasallia pustulata]|uniref:Uncharacterized protein n=1 Tax=Lasallia pustulata TaxID=136370 RepID=A0A5M8Q001_9LECA|nr:MAG: hypothetical protein FRX48_01445 [Lasallia pustulata]
MTPKPKTKTTAPGPVPAPAAPRTISSTELYEERDARDSAARVLGSWELVALLACAGLESIPQTRLRLEKQLMGISAEKMAEGDEWEDCFDEEDEDEKGAKREREGAGAAGGRREKEREKGEAGRKRKG